MDYIRKKSSFFFPFLFSSLHVFISSFEKCFLQALQIVMIPPRLPSDGDILKDMDQDDLLIFQMVGNDGFQHQ